MSISSFSSDSLVVLAQTAAPAGPQSIVPQLVMMGLLFAAMWFLLIAPQRKKQKEHEKMMKELKSGDEIVTTGGLYGTIVSVKEDRFVIRIGDNVKVEIGKGFIHSVDRKPTV